MARWRPNFPSHMGGVEGLLKLLEIGKPGRSHCVCLTSRMGRPDGDSQDSRRVFRVLVAAWLCAGDTIS